MYIPAPATNLTNSPRFVGRKLLFAEQTRIKRKPPPTIGEEVRPGLLCWGTAGELPSGEPVPMVSVNVETHTEISRETTPVRIENPDDPDQHVNVDQTNKMKLRKTEPVEKNNSATQDGFSDHLDALEATGDGALIEHARNIRTGNYTVQYAPPNRAL